MISELLSGVFSARAGPGGIEDFGTALRSIRCDLLTMSGHLDTDGTADLNVLRRRKDPPCDEHSHNAYTRESLREGEFCGFEV